jgi:NAD(P)-dependent dehydrogenase (short-subunit alcohol dehydrogenase family)
MVTGKTLEKLFPSLDEIPVEQRLAAPIQQRTWLVNGELRTWNGNCKSVLSPVCVRLPDGEASKVMAEDGRIISIGSGAASSSPWPGIADYSASKAAVAAYTRGWARDLGPKGITVNVVQPGPIDTEMNPADGASSDLQKAGTALGRYGRADEIGATVALLASQGAAFITGASIDVDGGYNA